MSPRHRGSVRSSTGFFLGRLLRLASPAVFGKTYINLDDYNSNNHLGQLYFYIVVESTLTPGPNVVVTLRFLMY